LQQEKRKMHWKNLKKISGNQFRRVVGVKKNTFIKFAAALRPKWNLRRRAGGPRPKLGLEDQLLLALSYLRNYGTFLETGAKFGVSESAAFYICRWIENCLIAENILHIPGKKELLAGKEKYEVVVFDVTECPIERPKRNDGKTVRNATTLGKRKNTRSNSRSQWIQNPKKSLLQVRQVAKRMTLSSIKVPKTECTRKRK
jgi:hypothetical protein